MIVRFAYFLPSNMAFDDAFPSTSHQMHGMNGIFTVSTSPKLNSSPLVEDEFPVGARPIFRGYVKLREGNLPAKNQQNIHVYR